MSESQFQIYLCSMVTLHEVDKQKMAETYQRFPSHYLKFANNEWLRSWHNRFSIKCNVDIASRNENSDATT